MTWYYWLMTIFAVWIFVAGMLMSLTKGLIPNRTEREAFSIFWPLSLPMALGYMAGVFIGDMFDS